MKRRAEKSRLKTTNYKKNEKKGRRRDQSTACEKETDTNVGEEEKEKMLEQASVRKRITGGVD